MTAQTTINTMRRVAAAGVLAGLCAVTLSCSASAPGGNPSGIRNNTDSLLQRDADRVHAAGVSGVVADVGTARGEMIARSGVGNRRSGSPVPPHGYIRIGSTTKTFTATVILQLAGEGKLSLDDTISHWLPGVVSGNGNDGSKITVRELLQHTSGLYDYTQDLATQYETPAKYEHNRTRTYTPLQFVDMALRHRPNFAPGTGYSYSSTNYVLLGMLIQRVTGQTWQEQVRSRILRPLGMRHTVTPDVTTSLPSPHALLYQQFVPGGPLVDVTAPALALEMGADGSIITTTADLNTFFRALLGGRLLRPAQLAAMEQTVPEPDSGTIVPGTRYGLGLQRYPLPCGGGYWTHSGDGLGYDVEDGVSADGRTSVVVYLDSLTFDRAPFIAQLKAADRLISDQLCGQR